ncbi:aminopeptidase P family protein [Echinicola sp. CAU 1574]|uniref:Xaa-Pro aminopeptidase n=1 Tax=Echinicola arenosa TaxID=2774144 RepID=A0ABR9AS11_9BACT|nr:aminopeptidase P family protein [Echinicola arenosa]MBD8491151.1 aminopeptidase P family protein [Echinicola arenosa]
MRYNPLDQRVYIKNRSKLKQKLNPRSLVIIHSNDVMPTNADGTMKFRQNNDLFYLSGIDQEETILVMCPDFPNESMREILLVRETNEHIAIWEGNKLTKKRAEELSGIKNVQWTSNYEATLATLTAYAEHIYLSTNEHRGASHEIVTKNAREIEKIKKYYPLHEFCRLAPIVETLRSVKEEEEVEQIQRACDITEKGFRRVLTFIGPGVMEYEIEAEYMHEFLRQGSRGFAYEPIIGSGYNSCVLHYLENDQVCQSGDLILMDVGAEYGNYNADMTRTVPVSGKFNERQKSVYNAVLRVKREAVNMLRPSVAIQEYQKEVGKVMESELVGLGLLDRTDVKNQDPANPLYRKYFMHGTSHHLGLDVHDVGSVYEPIQKGMVFTVEPGIYIREEGIGIRLENNYVIGENRNLDLMANIPIEVEEIEEIMNF